MARSKTASSISVLSQIVLQTGLLTGLLLTGLVVDKQSMAHGDIPHAPGHAPGLVANHLPVLETSAPQFDDMLADPFKDTAWRPATVELHITSDTMAQSQTIYFARGSISLTDEAQFVLAEITNDTFDLENTAISLTSQDDDALLGFERVEAVAAGLVSEGFSGHALFTPSQNAPFVQVGGDPENQLWSLL